MSQDGSISRKALPNDVASRAAPNEIISDVIGNAVVWQVLGKCLNFADLKDCRAVSRQFNRMVMDHTNFRSRAVVCLSLKDDGLFELGRTAESWKHFDFQLNCLKRRCVKPEVPSWLASLIKEAEFITLERTCKCSSAVVNAIMTSPMKRLSGISLNIELLNEDFVFLEENFRNIRRLEFTGKSVFDESGYMTDAVLEQLRKCSPLCPAFNELMLPRTKLVTKMIEKSQSQIRNLALDPSFFRKVRGIPEMPSMFAQAFPALQTLKMRTMDTSSTILCSIIESLTCLRGADITVLGKFPNQVLEVLECTNKELKALRIKAKELYNSDANVWRFLGGLRLEDFELHIIRSREKRWNVGFLREIFSNLHGPVHRICIRGSLELCQNPAPSFLDVSGIDPMALTKLELVHCYENITDRTVEYICRNFKRLQHLDLSYAGNGCTDYGFTGKLSKEGVSEFSLSSLTGLKHLALRSCGSISDFTLMEAVKFLELRYLDISLNPKVTRNGCLQVITHNHSLEILCSSLKGMSPSKAKDSVVRFKSHLSIVCEDPRDVDDSDSDHEQNYFDYEDYSDESDEISTSSGEYGNIW